MKNCKMGTNVIKSLRNRDKGCQTWGRNDKLSNMWVNKLLKIYIQKALAVGMLDPMLQCVLGRSKSEQAATKVNFNKEELQKEYT